MYMPGSKESRNFQLSTSFDNLAVFIKTCMQIVNCTMDGLDHYLEVHGIIKLWIGLYQNGDKDFVKKQFFPEDSLASFKDAYTMYIKIIKWVTGGCQDPLRLRDDFGDSKSETAVLHYFVATSATFKADASEDPPRFDQSICFDKFYLGSNAYAVYNEEIPALCEVKTKYNLPKNPAFFSCNMVRIIVNKETNKYNLSYAAGNEALEKLMKTKDDSFNTSGIISAIQYDIDTYGRPNPNVSTARYTPYANISAVADVIPGTSSTKIQSDLPLTSDFQLPITTIINQSLGLDTKGEVDVSAETSTFKSRQDFVLEAVKYSQKIPTNIRPSYLEQFQNAETTMNNFLGGHNMNLGASIVLFPKHVDTLEKAKGWQRFLCNYLGHDISFTCQIEEAYVYTIFKPDDPPAIYVNIVKSEGETKIKLPQDTDCAQYFNQAFDAQIYRSNHSIDYSVCIHHFPGAYGPDSSSQDEHKHFGFVLPWVHSTTKDYDLKSHGYVTIPLLDSQREGINNSIFNLKQLMALRFGQDGKVKTNTSASTKSLSIHERIEFITKRQVYIDYAIIRLIADNAESKESKTLPPISPKVLEILIATLVKIHALITFKVTGGAIPLETTSDIYLLHDVLVSVQRLAYIAAVYGNEEYSFWDYLDYDTNKQNHGSEASYLEMNMGGLIKYSQSQVQNESQKDVVEKCFKKLLETLKVGPPDDDSVFRNTCFSNKCLTYNDDSALFLQEVKYETRTPNTYSLQAGVNQVKPNWISASQGYQLTSANVITHGYIHPADHNSTLSMKYHLHNDSEQVLVQVPGTIETEVMDDGFSYARVLKTNVKQFSMFFEFYGPNLPVILLSVMDFDYQETNVTAIQWKTPLGTEKMATTAQETNLLARDLLELPDWIEEIIALEAYKISKNEWRISNTKFSDATITWLGGILNHIYDKELTDDEDIKFGQLILGDNDTLSARFAELEKDLSLSSEKSQKLRKFVKEGTYFYELMHYPFFHDFFVNEFSKTTKEAKRYQNVREELPKMDTGRDNWARNLADNVLKSMISSAREAIETFFNGNKGSEAAWKEDYNENAVKESFQNAKFMMALNAYSGGNPPFASEFLADGSAGISNTPPPAAVASPPSVGGGGARQNLEQGKETGFFIKPDLPDTSGKPLGNTFNFAKEVPLSPEDAKKREGFIYHVNGKQDQIPEYFAFLKQADNDYFRDLFAGESTLINLQYPEQSIWSILYNYWAVANDECRQQKKPQNFTKFLKDQNITQSSFIDYTASCMSDAMHADLRPSDLHPFTTRFSQEMEPEVIAELEDAPLSLLGTSSDFSERVLSQCDFPADVDRLKLVKAWTPWLKEQHAAARDISPSL